MKSMPWKSIACTTVLLTGCSGPQEDVRVTFCKNLTTEFLQPGTQIQWHDSEQKINGYEPAEITVHLETNDQSGQPQAMQATCFYRYDAVDENAMTVSNPISAYATVPSQMTLNGRPIPETKLRETILVSQLAKGKAVVDQVKQGIEAGVDKIHSAISNDSKQ